MNDKNRVHLSEHQTILNQTLQEQLVSLEFNARYLHAHMNTRVADYVSELSAYDRRSATDYALELSAYDRRSATDYALELSAYDRRSATDYASELSAYAGLPSATDYASKLSAYAGLSSVADYASELSAYDSLTRATDYASELSAYDSLTRATDFASELSAYDRRSVADFASELSAYDSLPSVADFASELSAYDSLTRATDYASELSAYDSLTRATDYASDWQKRVNFLSETQASLGFPNIIRGELAVDPFRISTPTQRRTPLFDLPPTSSTGEVYEEISPEIIPAPSPELVPITNQDKVFIVHGHDHASRDTVADFVDNWGLIPIVLDDQPNKGRTIIEKFEDLADDAGFAIVLLTPDDVGASVTDKTDLKYRARQNVILELGYFLKAVGRPKVCILYKEGVELPSDIHGILYVHMDDAGEWRQKVIKEMGYADLLIDVSKI